MAMAMPMAMVANMKRFLLYPNFRHSLYRPKKLIIRTVVQKSILMEHRDIRVPDQSFSIWRKQHNFLTLLRKRSRKKRLTSPSAGLGDGDGDGDGDASADVLPFTIGRCHHRPITTGRGTLDTCFTNVCEA